MNLYVPKDVSRIHDSPRILRYRELECTERSRDQLLLNSVGRGFTLESSVYHTLYRH